MHSVNVFDPQERQQLAGDPQLSVYEWLTKDHVIGLLNASGNYLARRPGIAELEADDVAADRALIEFCRRTYSDPETPLTQQHEPFVFSDHEQRELRLHKYVRGSERITRPQLLKLLRIVRAFSAAEEVLPYMPSSMTITNRFRHAHNWLIRFGQAPLTDAEFVKDLHQTVLSKRPGRERNEHPILSTLALVLIALVLIFGGGTLVGVDPSEQGRLAGLSIIAGVILGAWSTQSAERWTRLGFLWRFGVSWLIVILLGIVCGGPLHQGG